MSRGFRKISRWLSDCERSANARDVFGRTPIRKGLRFFRTVYYIFSLIHLRRSIAARRRRAFNIRDDSQMRLTRG